MATSDKLHEYLPIGAKRAVHLVSGETHRVAARLPQTTFFARVICQVVS